jgi:hypothetical protein
MRPECPSPQSLALKCRYCGGNHDISVCTKMIGDDQYRNQNEQVYQVDNSNSNNNSNNNNGGSNSNGNWNRGIIEIGETLIKEIILMITINKEMEAQI